MTKIEIMYLCDRLAGWHNDFAPYDEPMHTADYWNMVAFKNNRQKLLESLNQVYEEMSVDNEDDERSFKELGAILEELSKI